MTHTPGPWRVVPANQYHGAYVVDDTTDVTVCDLYYLHAGAAVALPNAETNARLIAAAPVLLEALEKAEKQFRWYTELHEAKGPEHAAKADRNREGAERCAAAIAQARWEG